MATGLTTEHTPGPWSRSARSYKFPVVQSAGGQFIAAFGGPGGIYANAEANARLVEAAPDLLTTLEEIETGILASLESAAKANGDRDLLDFVCKARAYARAAIARAEGAE